VSVLAGPPLLLGIVEPPIVADESGLLGTLSEYSVDSMLFIAFLRR
jgi:hypothetical protein